MIKNLWERISFYCINGHDEPVKMRIQEGSILNGRKATDFYACPKYFPENRAETERPCLNRMNLIDAEGVVLKFSEVVAQDEDMMGTDFTNYEFDYKGVHTKIHVKVLKYSDHKIKLGIKNLTALK